MYSPWYFYGGYAIHGSSSVPPYPASHGCVRVTTWDADFLSHHLEIGIPVHVWD
jgi:lipoprotein-anchoring transpeptidase ErfK/SrfK